MVPDGVTYVASSITGGDSRTDVDPAVGGLTWTVNSLDGGDTAVLTFQAVVDNMAKANFGTVTNSASLTSVDQIDSVSTNDVGTVDITPQSLDIALVKTVSNDRPVEVEIITYTIAVSNLSGQPTTNVVIRDIVPTGVTYVPATIAGGDVRVDADPAGAGLTWTVSSIAPGTTVNLNFQAQVDIGSFNATPTITNTANFVSMDQTEDTPANNTSSVVIEVQPIDIEVEKIVSNATPNEDTVITYLSLIHI